MPSFTSSDGSTPDSRSRIIQPSVRTVSLTQNGIRHNMKSSELARPRASFAMIQAMGNASSSVRKVAITDMHGGAHEHMPVQRLGEESPVLGETRDVVARPDALAEREHGQIDVRQNDERAEPEEGGREQQAHAQPAAPPGLERRLAHITSRSFPPRGARESKPRARGRS